MRPRHGIQLLQVKKCIPQLHLYFCFLHMQSPVHAYIEHTSGRRREYTGDITRPSRIHLLIWMQLHWHPLMRIFEDVWATVASLCFQRCCQPCSLVFCSQAFKETYVLEIFRCFSAPGAQASLFCKILVLLVVLPNIQDLHCWFTFPLRVTS